jgi:HD-like signal output (HDOD) protein
MTVWYALIAVTVAVGAWTVRRISFAQRSAATDGQSRAKPDAPKDFASSNVESDTQTGKLFRSDAIVDAQNAVYKLAFSVARTDYDILGDHLKVLAAIETAVGAVANESRYFPRRPALLPKLLRAINTVSSGRNEIVRLILQDAVLAGNVLKRANSVYYSAGKEVIESVDRAVTILGNEGLRAPVASAVMQPVFQLPSGFFESFAPVTWEQARRTAIAAEQYARLHNTADAFVAHLAGMLEGLARIVLFRLTMDKYREQGNIMPRAEVFIRIMQGHSQKVARAVASAWEMTPPFLEAIDAQIAEVAPARMSPLARTLYYANLYGTFATLHRHGLVSAERARDVLVVQGLQAEHHASIWQSATDTDLI